jgi:hypothetical protein
MAPENQDQLKIQALEIALRQLGFLQIPHWVCNGTLLGIIRDGQLIPWDTDLDIGVPSEFNNIELYQSFLDHGLTLFDEGQGSDYITFDFRGIRVDLNFFHEVEHGKALETLWLVPKPGAVNRLFFRLQRVLPLPRKFQSLFSRKEGYRSLTKDLYPIQTISALGMEIPVPKHPDKVLSFTYGESWRVPNPGYQWRIDGSNNAAASLRSGPE